MKPEELSPKAKEDRAKSLIDLGSSLFKASLVVLFSLPITLIIKAGVEGTGARIVPNEILGSMDSGTYVTLLSFLAGAVISGLWFQNQGLRIIHEMENKVAKRARRAKWKR